MAAPNKDERQKCWDSRDALWKCLDESAGDVSKCKHFRQQFEGNCKKQWVKYFDRRRDYLKYQEKIEKDGFEPIEDKDNKS